MGAVQEGFLRRGSIPGVIGSVDGSLIAIIAPEGEQKVAFMCRKGYYALNTMFVSDSGYPLEPWFLTPVTGHLPIHTAEGRYNTAHAAMWSVVERCIGLLKSPFRCLQRYRALHYEPDRAANIVAACAVLHNLCLDEGNVLDVVSDDSSNSSSDDDSGNPSAQRVPRGRAARMMYLRGCAAQDNVISSFGTTRQQHQHYLRRVRRRLRRQQQRQQQ
ncbi:putative nuclease HARBI1 [Dermacentor albipictus]|uniref:putative nuclease HARBI1 n=1 Tax=Dermacentor albipictus TaxID=60249 RepID=UPI0031FC18C5